MTALRLPAGRLAHARRSALGAATALVALALPASASATLTTTFASGFEDEPVRVTAYVFDTPPTRVVVTVHPDSRPCGATPQQDGGPVVIDGTADEDGADLAARVTLAEPGGYLVCGWALDPAGNVTETSRSAGEIRSQVAEVVLALSSTRYYRGALVDIAYSVDAARGRVVQTAILRSACPAVAPEAGDAAVVRWLPSPEGRTVGGSGTIEGGDPVALRAPGAYEVCTWVGEHPGDPSPEGVGRERFTVLPGKARPALIFSAERGGAATDPVRWGAAILGAFRGTLLFEARRAGRGPGDRIVGAGRWRPLGKVRLATLRPRFFPDAAPGPRGIYALATARSTRLPRSIGACGVGAKIAFVRVRLRGTGVARDAVSRPLELTGTYGAC